ncbi:MAG: phospholipase [Acidimicrobiales bacterium]
MTAGDALVVDIGGETGALVVYAPADLAGQEIEIARDGTIPDHPVHNVVRPRRIGIDDVVCAAVFPDLPAGRYVPFGGPRVRAEAFTVTGGRVTEIEWRLPVTSSGHHGGSHG